MASYQLRRKSDILEAEYFRACDGDTIQCWARVWPTLKLLLTVRIAEIESPELKSEHRTQALNARAFLDDHLRGHLLHLHPAQGGPDRYGRTRAHVWIGEENLADILINRGFAWRVPPSHTHANPAPQPTRPEIKPHAIPKDQNQTCPAVVI